MIFRNNGVILPETEQNGIGIMARLSESMEDYLEAIAELIAVDGHAHTKEIAQKLNVKMPSVTGALRQLEQLGYIIYNTHYPVQLTEEGKRVADGILKRHLVLKNFFSGILGLPAEKASETACRLEHAVDDETISRFTLFSEAIELRQDAKQLQTYLTEAMQFLQTNPEEEICVLSQLKPEESGIMILIGRNITSADVPETGKKIVLKNISLDKTVFTIEINGTTLNLPISTAENLWVKKC